MRLETAKQYAKKYHYEEFATLAKNAKIIEERDIVKEYIQAGAKKAPTKRLSDFFNGWKQQSIPAGVDFAAAGIDRFTDEEFEFIKKGFTIWDELGIPEQLMKNDSRKLRIHFDSTDVGVLAAKLGYDAIYDSRTDYTVVLNRTKMIILDREKDLRSTDDIFRKNFVA